MTQIYYTEIQKMLYQSIMTFNFLGTYLVARQWNIIFFFLMEHINILSWNEWKNKQFSNNLMSF